jgi:hypothetical protein
LVVLLAELLLLLVRRRRSHVSNNYVGNSNGNHDG